MRKEVTTCFHLLKVLLLLTSKDSLHKYGKEAGFNPPAKPLEKLSLIGLEKSEGLRDNTDRDINFLQEEVMVGRLPGRDGSAFS